MADLVQRYINPNSTSGGNGTTNSTDPINPNRAFVDIEEWETNSQEDLVSEDHYHIVTIEGDGDWGNCTIDGWTTDWATDNYIKLEQSALYRHDGTWDATNKPYSAYTSGFGNVYIREDAVWLDGLQFEITDQPTGYNAIYQAFSVTATSAANIFTNCFFNGSSVQNAAYGIFCSAPNCDIYVINCIFTMGASGRTPIQIQSSANAYVYNNTIYNLSSYVALYLPNTTNIVSNNIIGGSHSNVDGGYNNAYVTSDPGTGGIDISGYTPSQIWTDSANNDFTLAASSPVIDQGVDLSSDPYYPVTDDVAGTVRSTFDIGAHEYVSGGTVIERTVTTAGTATVSADSSTVKASEHTSAGIATTTIIAACIAFSAGGSAGQASVSGYVSYIMPGEGASAGVGMALAASQDTNFSEGTASGTTTVLGVSRAICSTSGTSAGQAVAVGSSDETGIQAVDGTSAGSATVYGFNGSIFGSEGTSAGSCISSGFSNIVICTDASAAGQSTVSGSTDETVLAGYVESSGLGMATGISSIPFATQGTAVGEAVAIGDSYALQMIIEVLTGESPITTVLDRQSPITVLWAGYSPITIQKTGRTSI